MVSFANFEAYNIQAAYSIQLSGSHLDDREYLIE